MTQQIEVSPVAQNAWAVRRASSVWRLALLGSLVMVLYFAVVLKLIQDWWQLADYSYGVLVPIFSAYLVFNKRDRLKRVQLRPSWTGVVVVACALILLLAGVYGAQLFLERLSLLVLLGGLVLGFGGSSLLRELRFPLLVLLLAIPIPAILLNQVTFPLQTLASELATAMLPLFGVPVLREGHVINLPSMSLEVAEACSGIRSLMSLLTLSIFYGYFMENSSWRRVWLALVGIPIAIAANALRIIGTGLCVQYWNPDKAVGFFHEFSGWVMFVSALSCLLLVHRAMSLLIPPKRNS